MQVPSTIVEAPDGAVSTAEASAESAKGLRADTLNLFSNTLFAVASVAPAYSLAVTLGFIVAAVGLHAPFVIIVSFIPMSRGSLSGTSTGAHAGSATLALVPSGSWSS